MAATTAPPRALPHLRSTPHYCFATTRRPPLHQRHMHTRGSHILRTPPPRPHGRGRPAAPWGPRTQRGHTPASPPPRGGAGGCARPEPTTRYVALSLLWLAPPRHAGRLRVTQHAARASAASRAQTGFPFTPDAHTQTRRPRTHGTPTLWFTLSPRSLRCSSMLPTERSPLHFTTRTRLSLEGRPPRPTGHPINDDDTECGSTHAPLFL
jgi:hypothetical protein